MDRIDTDPTGGTGNILVANGATDSGTAVWFETVSVTPNTNYTFSFFGVDVNADRVSDATLIPFFRVTDVTEGSALDTNGDLADEFVHLEFGLSDLSVDQSHRRERRPGV